MFIETGKLNSFTGVLIPGIEESSNAEILLNIAYIIISSLLAAVSLFFVQCLFALICNTMMVTADLTIMGMEDLSEHLERNDLNSNEVRLRVKRLIVQILKGDE